MTRRRTGRPAARGRFEESKHKRERSGRFGNKPGAVDDAPRRPHRSTVGERRLKERGVGRADIIVVLSDRSRRY